MKKQLLILLICAAALPVGARPDTITMEVPFPNSALSYPSLNVTEKLEVVPTSTAQMTVAPGSTTTTPPLNVTAGTTIRANSTATLHAPTLTTPDQVSVGNIEGVEGRANFTNLTVQQSVQTGDGAKGIGLKANVLTVSDSQLMLFPDQVMDSAVMKDCDQVSWQKVNNRLFLTCGAAGGGSGEEEDECQKQGGRWIWQKENELQTCHWNPEDYCTYQGQGFAALFSHSYTPLCANQGVDLFQFYYVDGAGPCSETPKEAMMCIANENHYAPVYCGVNGNGETEYPTNPAATVRRYRSYCQLP